MSSVEGELRWEVDEMGKFQAAGLGFIRDSPTTAIIGGLTWKLRIHAECSPRTANERSLGVFVACSHPEAKRFWRAEVQVAITLENRRDETASRGGVARPTVLYPDIDTYAFGEYRIAPMEEIMDKDKGFLLNDKIIVKAHIAITKAQGFESLINLSDFSEANERTDICLIVENMRVHVTRAILAQHSPVFQKMFYGSFEENGKREIELKDIKHKDFVQLLNVTHTSLHEINDESVEGILALADRFHMTIVLEAVGIFLMLNSRLFCPNKLLLTDIYKLDQAQAYLLYTIKSSQDMKIIQKTDCYRKFSDVLKARVCDRAAELP